METITLTGLVATDPREAQVDGVSHIAFRMATSVRKFDIASSQWESTPPNWFTVICKKSPMVTNVATQVSKGARVIVVGKLAVTDWDNGKQSGTTLQVEAESIGVDLGHTTIYSKDIEW